MYNGISISRIARINSDGSLDTGFTPGTGAGSTINAIAIQSDGKILIGGTFTTYIRTFRGRIARINSDGSLDTVFNQGMGADQNISTMAIQSDGKIVIGGQFTTYNGTSRFYIARINSDGSLDTGFDSGTGADNNVNAIAIQSDGKILIGGEFTTYNGTTRNRIARINSDGSLDTGFDPGTGANNTINAMAIQSDGKIVIGGTFTTYNGTTRNRIARINSDGSLDTGFDSGGAGASSSINAIAIQSDGKIVIGGQFTTYQGTTRNRIARINSNGNLDTGFTPGTGAGSSAIYAIAIQSDGKILIGGGFTTYNGTTRNSIARINTDGSLDTGFDPGTGADNFIRAFAIQSDGKIVIGGQFTTYNGTARNRIARINTDGSLDTGFDPGSGITVTFEFINAMAIQSDGKVVIGGQFTSYNGTARTRIARILNCTATTVSANSSSSSICIGASATLSGTGATTYAWQPGNLTGSPSVSPSSTTTYTVTGTDANGCSNTGTYQITVNALPSVGINSSASTICNGASASLSGTGATTYAWQPGNLTGSPSVSLSSTTTYTVIGTDANGCSNTATYQVTVNALPSVGINSSAASICNGTSATLSGTGASSYAWMPGSLSGSPSVSPSSTTTYTVTGTNGNGCTNTATYQITVNALPTVGINSSAASICNGLSATLNGTGASSYTWMPGSLTGSPSVSPSSTTTYTVTGTDANGCSNTGTYQITVNALPSVGINSSASTICIGASASLSGSGASTYAWQPGNLTGSPVVSPTSNTTYTVVGTDANGCTNSSTTLISIYAPGNPLCTQAPCGMPTSISATPTYNSVVINFTKALSANTTFIQTRVKGTANWGGSSITGQSLTINYLIPSTVYEYRLRSSCTGATSLFTSISEFTTPVYVAPLPNCNAPTNINATVTGANSVTLTWTASVGAQQYFVQYKPSTSSWANSFGSTAYSTTKTFTNLVPNTTYDYRVRTTCVTGQTMNPGSTFSSINNFTTLPSASSALFNVNESAWSIYPNPTHDLVQLEFTSSVEEALTIMVFDMTGRLVQSVVTQSLKGNNQIDISLGTLSNGMYIIKSRQGNAVTTLGKVTKN
jgi:uncharacterized delta-60 repeat protein